MSKVKSYYWDEINAIEDQYEPDPECDLNPSFVSYVNGLIDSCLPEVDLSAYIEYTQNGGYTDEG